MKRLIAFGCSSTYGQGLPDCLTGEEKPSKFAWPHILATDLNIECINTSTCGAPNKKILLQILDFPFKKDDIVVTLWSLHHRGYIYSSKQKAESIFPTMESCKDFYMIHTEYDMCVDMTLYMHHAKQYLSNLNIRNHHFYFDDVMYDHVSSKKNIVNVTADFVPYGDLQVDKATDGIHLGVDSQKNMMSFIFHKIRMNEKK